MSLYRWLREKTGRVIYARSLYDATLDRSYEYDHVGRLTVSHTGAEARAHVGLPAGTQWGTLDGPYSHAYEYDARGNLLRRQGWGGLLGGSPGSFNEQVSSYAANNRRAGFTYDAAGNLTNEVGQQFTYDATGQQAAATFTGSSLGQAYDGDRLRVKKRDSGVATFYLRSSVLGGQVVAELSEAGAWRRGYVYGAGGELLAIRSEAGVRWVHQDPATKSQRLTDSSGVVAAVVDLDPWGGETSRSWNSALQPRKFTSYERDTNADDEAMHRRYARRHGRFSQPDPSDGSYDLADPQSLNRYAYVQNDPVNFTDPSGLQEEVWDPGEVVRIATFTRGLGTTLSEMGFGRGDVRPITDAEARGNIGGEEQPLNVGLMDEVVVTDTGDPCHTIKGAYAELPQQGPGFYTYSPRRSWHLYGEPGVIANLINLAANWHQKHPNHPIGIGDIGQRGGAGNYKNHPSSGHAGGVIVDIRPMRNDGRKSGTAYNRGDGSYGQALTKELVNDLRTLPGVKSIIFNDPTTRTLRDGPVRRGTSKTGVHDNHLHVTFFSGAGCR